MFKNTCKMLGFMEIIWGRGAKPYLSHGLMVGQLLFYLPFHINQLLCFSVAIDLFTFTLFIQSELPRPIPQNSVESDHGCTSRI